MLSQRPLNERPAGAENYDQGALTDEQQAKLNQKKVCVFSLFQVQLFFYSLIFALKMFRSNNESITKSIFDNIPRFR